MSEAPLVAVKCRVHGSGMGRVVATGDGIAFESQRPPWDRPEAMRQLSLTRRHGGQVWAYCRKCHGSRSVDVATLRSAANRGRGQVVVV